MRQNTLWIVGLLILVGLLLSGCSQPSAATTTKELPAVVEKIEGKEVNRLVLTEKAAERLGIQTTVVQEEQVGDAQRLVVPYSALIYDLEGTTWAYTNPDKLTYVRQPVTVEYIEGDRAVLVDGLDAGSVVVTVGVAELYGADTGIGK